MNDQQIVCAFLSLRRRRLTQTWCGHPRFPKSLSMSATAAKPRTLCIHCVSPGRRFANSAAVVILFLAVFIVFSLVELVVYSLVELVVFSVVVAVAVVV